jgi:hypothetical protein
MRFSFRCSSNPLRAVFLWAAFLALGAHPVWAENEEIVVGTACSTTNDSVGYATIFTCSGGAWARSAYFFGNSAATCDASHAGLTRYNGGSLQYCNGSAWTTLASSGSATNFAAGTVGSPGFYVTGDSNTGLWAAVADTLNIAAGGVEAFRFNTTASAVNYLAVTPATTGNAPVLSAAGSDTNIDLKLTPKGTGNVNITAGGIKFNGANGLSVPSGSSTSLLAGTSGGTAMTGTDNTGFGYQALNANTTGNYNTAVGTNALRSNTTGNYNTAVGRYALQMNVTGQFSTAVGYNALTTATGSFNTAMGYWALGATTTGGGNTAVGYNALAAATTASGLTAVGSTALDSNTTGTDNTAVGYAALTANTTGADNTALGYNALAAATTASGLTAVGSTALDSNTTGTDNTAVGYAALTANTTGNYNTAVGSVSLGLSTTGSQNTAVGRNALGAVTTGNQNTAIGNSACSGVTTGSTNICIGYLSGVASATGSNQLSIGNAIYGDLSTPKIGIGQSSPNATLDVNGYIKLKTNSAAPVACSATYQGSIAYTGGTTNYLCFCDGTSWKQVHSPATACTW